MSAFAGHAFAQPAAAPPAAPAPVPAPPARAAAPAPEPQIGPLGEFPTNLAGFSWSANMDANLNVSSNGRGLPRRVTTAFGKKGPDEYAQGSLSIAMRDHTARFSGDLAYTLSGSAFVRNSGQDRISHKLNAITAFILVPEHVTLQARAFARQIYVNYLGALGIGDQPVASGPNSGLRQSLGFTVSPELQFRFGNFATSKTTLSENSIFFFRQRENASARVPDEDVPNTTTSYGVTETISSGSDFSRLNWSVVGSARQARRNGGEYSATAEFLALKYAVSREFALSGNAGYEAISSEQNLARDLRGPIWMGGFQYSPGPELQFTASGGRRFNFPSYTGALTYKISPFTILAGSVTDTVLTPAERLLGNLGSLGGGAQFGGGGGRFGGGGGGLGGANGGEDFDPTPTDGIGINNNISRFRSASLSLQHDDERTHYQLSAFGTVRDRMTVVVGGPPPRQESYGGTFSVSREFTPQVTGALSLIYSIHNVLGGRMNLIRVNFNMNYAVTQGTEIYMRAGYLRRLSSPALESASPLSGSLGSALATVGLRQNLY